MPKDIRTLCSQHAKEMIYAKYALIRTHNHDKSECDKCPRQGWEYAIIPSRNQIRSDPHATR